MIVLGKKNGRNIYLGGAAEVLSRGVRHALCENEVFDGKACKRQCRRCKAMDKTRRIVKGLRQ